jgi:hypothetical protein
VKYKAGDKILCSVSDSSLDPHDLFTVTIAFVRAHDYKATYIFHSEKFQVLPIEMISERSLDQFEKNYVIATSPLNQALS